MKNTIQYLSLAFVLTACGSFTPAEGTWTLSGLEVTEDTCQFPTDEEEEISDSEFSVALSDDGFSLDADGDGEDASPVACTLEGKNFTCESEVETSEEDTFTIAIETSLSGVFASETESTINLSIEVSCEGDDCALVEEQAETSFPCTMASSASGTLNE